MSYADSPLKAALFDEMEKISKEREAPGWYSAGGALGGLGLGALAFLARKPGIRAGLLANLKAVGKKGGARGVAAKAQIPQEVRRNANSVAEALLAGGVDPSKVRIAVSGTGGTGKSVFSKALAERMGMSHGYAGGGRRVSLGIQSGNLSVKPGTISEQTQLLNIADPSKFDVLIKMEAPLPVVRKRILGRGRGAGQLEFYRYGLMQKSINNAFKTTSGRTLNPASGVSVKIAPLGGFDSSALTGGLRAKGINPASLTREEQVLSLSLGKAVKPGSGNKALIRLKKRHPAGYAGVGITAGTGGGYAYERYR